MPPGAVQLDRATNGGLSGLLAPNPGHRVGRWREIQQLDAINPRRERRGDERPDRGFPDAAGACDQQQHVIDYRKRAKGSCIIARRYLSAARRASRAASRYRRPALRGPVESARPSRHPRPIARLRIGIGIWLLFPMTMLYSIGHGGQWAWLLAVGTAVHWTWTYNLFRIAHRRDNEPRLRMQ